MQTISTHMPASRRTDPETSHIAAARAVGFVETHAKKILAALADGHEHTAGEIGAACGLTVVQVDRRMHELEKDGKVVRYKSRFCRQTGTAMQTWRLS